MAEGVNKDGYNDPSPPLPIRKQFILILNCLTKQHVQLLEECKEFFANAATPDNVPSGLTETVVTDLKTGEDQ